jgi:ribosomal protein S12
MIIQERRKIMPTFNQLVRKGREQMTFKSTSPAMQKGLLCVSKVVAKVVANAKFDGVRASIAWWWWW